MAIPADGILSRAHPLLQHSYWCFQGNGKTNTGCAQSLHTHSHSGSVCYPAFLPLSPYIIQRSSEQCAVVDDEGQAMQRTRWCMASHVCIQQNPWLLRHKFLQDKKTRRLLFFSAIRPGRKYVCQFIYKSLTMCSKSYTSVSIFQWSTFQCSSLTHNVLH